MVKIILISVDGLALHIMHELGKNKLPNIYEIRNGLYTDNARTDQYSTETLPNHTCMVTGRDVYDDYLYLGHNIDYNEYKPNMNFNCKTIFNILNVNYNTSSYVSKVKLNYYGASDSYMNKRTGEYLVGKLIYDLLLNNNTFNFLHFGLTDAYGHSYGWNSQKYKEALIKTDEEIGTLLRCIKLLGVKVIVILSTDHGGGGEIKGIKNFFHSDYTDPKNYTIPLYIQSYPINFVNCDLYKIVECNGKYIRNGDIANLVMGIMGEKIIDHSKMFILYNLGKVIDNYLCK